jgi:nucleoside-diphosphate-sugar epimerase
MPIIIIRSGNIYGEGDMHWDRLIPGTIRSALLGKPFDWPTLGISLVYILASQLGGELRLERGGGTRYTLSFRLQ